MQYGHSDDDSNPKNVERKRGRPKKNDNNNGAPRQEQLFKRNSAAFLTVGIYYVGNILRILRRTVSNRGFLIYQEYSDEEFITNISEVGQIPEKLATMVRNILQCGPRPVVQELVELLRDIAARPETEPTHITNYLLRNKYAPGSAPRFIDFTHPDVFKNIEPEINISPNQREEIRQKFEEYFEMVVDIVKSELNEKNSDYYDRTIELIKANEPELPPQKNKSRTRTDLALQEPKTRKLRRPN